MGLNCSKCNHLCDLESQNEFQSRQKYSSLNNTFQSLTSQYQSQLKYPNLTLINPSSHIYLKKIIFLQKKIREYLQRKKTIIRNPLSSSINHLSFSQKNQNKKDTKSENKNSTN